MEYKTDKSIRIIILMSLLYLTCSCVERYYSIEELDMNMYVDRIDTKNKIYRVYLQSKNDSLINDYLDIRISSSDMPAISLHFPVDKPDTVFVLDGRNNVRRINSSKFKYILYNYEYDCIESATRYIHLRDSIKRNVKAVGIEVYLNGVSIWDENNNNRGIFKTPW